MSQQNYDEFPPEVTEQIRYYVYRLIDPRNGNTFYVGKGKGNRVFEHVKTQIKSQKDDDHDDEESLKFKTIREIQNEGLNVIHVIHRYNLTEEQAYAVEAALIDCFPGLTNIQSGHDSDYGVINTQTLIKNLSVETYKIDPNDRYILIKTSQQARENARERYPKASEEELTYHAVRMAWRLSLDRAKKYKFVIGSINGIVVGCYKNCKWSKDESGTRIKFEGEEADKEFCKKYFRKRIPDVFRQKGAANPCTYVDGPNM